MLITNSTWTNRLLIAVPFAIAALLNVLMLGVEHLHLRLDYIARYGFVFCGPWVWLVNFADITNRLNVQNRWLGGFITYVALLWTAILVWGCGASDESDRPYEVQEMHNPRTGDSVICGMGLDGGNRPTKAIVAAFDACVSDHAAAGFEKVDPKPTQ